MSHDADQIHSDRVDPSRAKSLFLVAVEQYTPEQWPEYLREACGNDAELRERVEVLLSAHQRADQLTNAAEAVIRAAVPAIAVTEVSEVAGTHIGPYRLLEKLGEGGMGVVFRAEQHEPVERQVALKIIRPGMDTERVMARFEAERQALAVMDHPHVAKVLDAGTTDSGRPYFVMELVQGQTITKYCDEHQLSIKERLELFIPVCQAVQHAHQKGIIHRDIKPSNILVAEFDGHGVPKVIDFGVAKAIDQPLAQKQLSTQFGQIVGTLEYMSPEQARFSQHDVDTRSDVYSLGVVLYELLTGITPFDKQQLYGAALDQALHIIETEEPPKPSQRLSDSDTLPSVAALRHIEPQRLTSLIHGELDWIVMKSLEKDRSRRYESATGLARDIENYLHDQPVLAGPPSAMYRFRKFARRNKGALAAVGLVALAMIAGTTVSSYQAVRATQAEQLAETRLGVVEQQREMAKQAQTAAEQSQQQAETITRYLIEAFRSPDPTRDGRTITVVEILDQAKVRVEMEFEGNGLLQARLLGALSETYLGLGLAQEANELAKKSYDMFRDTLGPQHDATVYSMNQLALTYKDTGQLVKALSLFKELLRLTREKWGPDDHYTLTAMNNLAAVYQAAGQLEQALLLHEEALRLQREKLGPDHPATLNSMNNVAAVYRAAGQLEQALSLFEETLRLRREKLGPEHPDTLGSMNSVASAYWSLGKLDQSIPLFEETVRLYRTVLGEDHPDTLRATANLGINYRDAGRTDQAVPLLEETLKRCQDKLTPGHAVTLLCMSNLAATYSTVGQLDKALLLREETLRIRKETLTPKHPQTLRSMQRLAALYLAAGQADKALPLCEESLRVQSDKLGPDHPDTLQSMNTLAGAYRDAGQSDKALPLAEEVLRISKEKLGPEHPDTLKSMNGLACVYWSLGRFDQSVPLFEELLRLVTRVLGEDHPATLQVMTNLGGSYIDVLRLDQALSLLEETLRLHRKKLGPEHPNTLTTMQYCAIVYRKMNRFDEAIRMADEVLAVAQKVLRPNNSKTLRTKSEIGATYSDAGRVAEAIELLEEVVERQREVVGPLHWNTLYSMHNLALAHSRAGHLDQAETILKETVQGQQKTLGAEYRDTLDSVILLGNVLVQRGQYAEAEPLLLESQQACATRQTPTPIPRDRQQMQAILTNLVQLYEASNQPDKAATWKRELDAVNNALRQEDAKEK